jgi:thioredoxin 1
MVRQTDGKTYELAGDQVYREKTGQINTVNAPPRRAIEDWAKEQAPTVPSGHAVPQILALRDTNFNAQVLKSQTPVLVEFMTTWCGYCRLFEPTVQAIAKEYAGRIRVGKVDIDTSPESAARYGIDGTPTVLLFKDGKVVGTIDGFASKAEVVRMLRSNL